VILHSVYRNQLLAVVADRATDVFVERFLEGRRNQRLTAADREDNLDVDLCERVGHCETPPEDGRLSQEVKIEPAVWIVEWAGDSYGVRAGVRAGTAIARTLLTESRRGIVWSRRKRRDADA